MIPALWQASAARLIGDKRGATAVEYGLILSLLVLATLAALSGLADAVVGKWTFIANRVTEL